jgi:nicotinate dehydrogenase subunit A
MIKLSVNGKAQEIDVDPDTPLLYVLRDDLQLNAAKFGCGLGQCGACTVIVDGEAVFSCLTPVSVLEGREIKTVEGLGSETDPGPLQRAFMEEQAAQCGYCTAGMMMRAQALLQKTTSPSDADIIAFMEPNLCRCGTQHRVLSAVRKAASLMKTAQASPAKQPATQGAAQ